VDKSGEVSSAISLSTLWVKKLCYFFTAYNFRNIEQIFTKFGTNQSIFILNIVPVYLNQIWKIVAQSSEWRWHFYNYKFWIVIIFLHHFSQPLCIVISLLLLINDVRMTAFTHQLLSRKTSTPEVWQCECEFDIPAAVLRCPSLHCAWARQKSFSFNQAESQTPCDVMLDKD